MKKRYDLFGLGSAMMDILVLAEESMLSEFNIDKGMMRLIDAEELKGILDKIDYLKPKKSPGGSVANTCAGIVRLGGSSVFCGIVGKDEHGILYEQRMKDQGVETRIVSEEGNGLTAMAVSFITPDSERSFATHLGISSSLAKEHIIEEDIAKSKVAHFEGYLLDGKSTREAMIYSMKLAKSNNTQVSFDVSDVGIIKRHRKIIEKVLSEYVDILFINEDEASEWLGKKASENDAGLAKISKIVVLKLGERGSAVFHENGLEIIDGVKAEAIDTTGAGDMYAAGFIYGLARGMPVSECGRIASVASSKVVEQIGARLDKDITHI